MPVVTPAPVVPRAPADDLTVTWIGHASCLIQLGGHNILTDPMWSGRASPVQWAGPRRLVPVPMSMDALPPIDVVLISHDHYDHLDRTTVRRLSRLHGAAVWFAPLGVGQRLRRWGAADVRELDWWQSATAGGIDVSCTPARHFSGRTLWDRMATLWCGWTIATGGRRAFFAGDTAYHPEFAEIARRHGPFDVAVLPIGAYDPRWFMAGVHMDPEDAVRAYRDLVSVHAEDRAPVMVPIHWGTFRLTDEPLDEPPVRLRNAWAGAGLPDERLWLLAHGETQRRGRVR